MAASCAPWVKYCLLFVLFIFSFIYFYTPNMDIYGFGSFFVLQTMFSMLILIDLTQDDEKYLKVLTVSVDKNRGISIPLSWVLFLGTCLEFLAAFFMVLTTNAVYKRFNSLQMSSENQWRLDFMKHTFVIVTVLMFVLILVYWNFDQIMANGSFKMILLMMFVGILGLSVADIVYANRFLQLISTVTDG